jgi:hypothetical protein
MPGLVDIVLPDGQQASVPEENLSLALSSGAKVDVARPAAPLDGGGLLGEAATAALGAGRTASMGFSDTALAEMANIIGGEQARKDTLSSMDIARRANPYSNMAGEFAGMFIGGPTSIGEGIETAVAEKVGEGLLGKVASFGARGVGEGALIAYQDGISEATLGDHEVNGQKLAAHIGEGAVLGGTLGAALGAGAHGMTTAVESLRGLRGVPSAAVLDEVAGVEGAGKLLREEAAETQKLITTLEKGGATTEQAAKMADEAMTFSRAQANSGGILEDVAAKYAQNRAGGNAQIEEALRFSISDRARKLAQRSAVLDEGALSMKAAGDRMMRGVGDTADEVQFTYKAEQMARHVDAARLPQQRDAIAAMLQKTDDYLRFWESTASKGGAEGAIKTLRKQHTDALDALFRIDEAGGAMASRDLMIRADGFKRNLDSLSRFGGGQFGLPEAVMGKGGTPALRDLGNLWRGMLEDAEVWGQAGHVQKRWNGAFSEKFARSKDFGSRFAVAIDEQAGVVIPEMDAKKIKDGLLKQMGSAADSQQALKSTDAYLSWLKDRANVIEEFGELTPKQAAALADGRAAIGEFEKALGSAKKEAEIIARIESLQLEEQGKALGGIMGLGADLVTRPLKTMERLGDLIQAKQKVEQAIEGGLKRFFGGKSGPELVAEMKPRAPEAVAKDIGEIKTLAANPAALDMRARQAVGDMAKVAPQTAAAAMATFKRAVYFLANEAPPAGVRLGVLAMNAPKPRYTEQQLHEWETKKRAAFDPKTVVFDMKSGRLNREAIRTIEFVSPKLYMEIQRSAQEYVFKLAQDGTIDKMPRPQQAALAALLKVPADGTWQPDFMLMMQAAKAQPAPQQAPTSAPTGQQTTRRAVKFNTGIYETEAYAIEKR